MTELRHGIWWVGIVGWTFGPTERTNRHCVFALLSDGVLSAMDLTQLFTALFFAVCWVLLCPALEEK